MASTCDDDNQLWDSICNYTTEVSHPPPSNVGRVLCTVIFGGSLLASLLMFQRRDRARNICGGIGCGTSDVFGGLV